MRAKKREVGKEDAERERINVLQAEGKEHGTTKGLKRPEREGVFLSLCSQTRRYRSHSTYFKCALGTQ